MPAKRKQASLKRTKSTTTYKRGGATKKKYQAGGIAGKLGQLGTGRPFGLGGKKSSVAGAAAKALKLKKAAAAKKAASKLKPATPRKTKMKMQPGGSTPGRNIAAPKGAKGIKRATLTKPRKADGSIDYSKMGKGAKLENPGKTASKREMKKFFKKAKRMQDGGMAPALPSFSDRDRRAARRAQFKGLTPGTGLIMDPGALMPGETGPITERQARTRSMMEGMKGGRDYTPFRSQADSMRTAFEQYRDEVRPGSEMNPINLPQMNINPAQQRQQGGDGQRKPGSRGSESNPITLDEVNIPAPGKEKSLTRKAIKSGFDAARKFLGQRNMQDGGSVYSSKDFRNNSRGRARKNR